MAELLIIKILLEHYQTSKWPGKATFAHCRPTNGTVSMRHISPTPTVLSAKNDNDVMFCLQTYEGLESIDRLYIDPICGIGLIHKWSTDSHCSRGVYTLMFSLTIVNKVLRHCHFWLARQYMASKRQPAVSSWARWYVCCITKQWRNTNITTINGSNSYNELPTAEPTP